MNLCKASIDQLSRIIPVKELSNLIHLAKKTQSLEAKWRGKMDRYFNKVASETADAILKGYTEPEVDFEKVFVEHFFDVAFEALDSTKRMSPVPSKLAYPVGPKPRSLKALMQLWDKWRKQGQAPSRQKAIAAKVKKEYLKKVQKVVGEYQRRAGSGEIIQKEEIVHSLETRSKMDHARAVTVVNTETTRYWNQVRRDTYDQVDDVTHYLYVPVRDHATTKWCKTRAFVVYKKGDPILKRETPPIHWNCRSELLPLSRLNPAHLKLIMNPALQRRNRSPAPLPPNFNRDAA